jgi:hypothetical protein
MPPPFFTHREANPLIWLPDAIAGAVASYFDPSERDRKYIERLTGRSNPTLLWP